MNLNDLRAFDAVARCGGFLRAATALNRAQPTVTAQVRNLERRYGVELFYRTRGQTARLTPFGERLFATTQQLFNLETDTELLLSGAGNAQGTALRIGAITPRWAIPLMRQLAERYPEIELSLSVQNSNALIEAILEYSIDIALLGAHEPDGRFFMRQVSTPEIVVVGHRDIEGYPDGLVDKAAFAKETLVHREPGSETRALVDRELARNDYVPGRTIVAGSREGVLLAVEHGLGIAAVSLEEIEEFRDVRVLRFADFGIFGEVHAVCLSTRRRMPVIEEALGLIGKLKNG